MPPSYPLPPLQVITKCLTGLLVSYSSFPLASYFTHGSIYMPISLYLNVYSEFISPALAIHLNFRTKYPITLNLSQFVLSFLPLFLTAFLRLSHKWSHVPIDSTQKLNNYSQISITFHIQHSKRSVLNPKHILNPSASLHLLHYLPSLILTLVS